MRTTAMRQETLFVRRMVGRALTELLKGLDLAEVAIQWNWDDPRQLLLWPDGAYRLAADWDSRQVGEGVAAVWVDLEQKSARVQVRRLDLLVRPNYRSELDVRQLGVVRDGRPFDIDMTISLEEVDAEELELLLATPQRLSLLGERRRGTVNGKPTVRRCRSKVGRVL